MKKKNEDSIENSKLISQNNTKSPQSMRRNVNLFNIYQDNKER